jgi:hypothetical protein
MAIDTTSVRFFYLRAQFKFGLWNGATPPTDFFGPINFTKMEITPPKQKMTRLMSNMEATFGNLLDAQPSVTDPATLSCEFDSMTSGMLNLLIGANTTAINQTSAAIASEAVTPILGIWTPLANRFIAPDSTGTPIVFKDAAAPTPVTITNDHFEFDYINGMFRPLDATGVTAVTVSYHTANRLGETYNAGLAVNKYVKFVGTATELSSAKRGALTIHKANLLPNGKLDIIGNNYIKGTLEGDMIIPTNYASPWEFDYLSDMSA